MASGPVGTPLFRGWGFGMAVGGGQSECGGECRQAAGATGQFGPGEESLKILLLISWNSSVIMSGPWGGASAYRCKARRGAVAFIKGKESSRRAGTAANAGERRIRESRAWFSAVGGRLSRNG